MKNLYKWIVTLFTFQKDDILQQKDNALYFTQSYIRNTLLHLTISQSSLYSVHFLRFIPWLKGNESLSLLTTIGDETVAPIYRNNLWTKIILYQYLLKHPEAFTTSQTVFFNFKLNVSSPSHFCVFTTLLLIFVLFTVRITLFFFCIHV